MSSSSLRELVVRARAGRADAAGRERALVEGVGEDADDVVGRPSARRSSMSSTHIAGELAERLGRGVQHRVVGVEVAVAGHHGVAPAVELLALVGVEAHQLGDDDERHVDGEVLDEVALAPLGDLVDDLVRQLADVIGELPDLRRA